jgi:hypothetical protein
MDPQATWKTFDPHITRNTHPAIQPKQIAVSNSSACQLFNHQQPIVTRNKQRRQN